MLWLKRNLLLVVSGLVTLLLLGCGGYYVFASINKNKEVEEQLKQGQSDLDTLYRLDPFPHATNIAKARQEKEKVMTALRETQKHFKPIPVEKVSDRDFSILLEITLSDLRRKAEQSGVLLPDKDKNYAFTFKEQQKRVKFAQGSFPALPELLADIKVICDILFDTRFNQLLNLRRVRLSTDDPLGAADFTELKIESHPGTGAVMVPFEIQIACFSSQLATLLENLGKSPHGFIVQVLTAEPLSGQSPEVKPPPPKAPVPGANPAVGVRPGVAPPAAAASAAAADNPVVLIEQTLKVDLLILVVKPQK
jgi:hypothetical protein